MMTPLVTTIPCGGIDFRILLIMIIVATSVSHTFIVKAKATAEMNDFLLVWFLTPLVLLFIICCQCPVERSSHSPEPWPSRNNWDFKSLYCSFLAVDDHYASCLQTPRAMTGAFVSLMVQFTYRFLRLESCLLW